MVLTLFLDKPRTFHKNFRCIIYKTTINIKLRTSTTLPKMGKVDTCFSTTIWYSLFCFGGNVSICGIK